jgi:four helix bundle protein
MRDFRKLEIWKRSKTLAIEIYRLTSQFPSSEKFGITNQINRSAISISSNIAEGANRSSEKDFSRFIEISLGSSFELETQLLIAQELNFGDKNLLKKILKELDEIQKMINNFHSKLKTSIANS